MRFLKVRNWLKEGFSKAYNTFIAQESVTATAIKSICHKALLTKS